MFRLSHNKLSNEFSMLRFNLLRGNICRRPVKAAGRDRKKLHQLLPFIHIANIYFTYNIHSILHWRRLKSRCALSGTFVLSVILVLECVLTRHDAILLHVRQCRCALQHYILSSLRSGLSCSLRQQKCISYTGWPKK